MRTRLCPKSPYDGQSLCHQSSHPLYDWPHLRPVNSGFSNPGSAILAVVRRFRTKPIVHICLAVGIASLGACKRPLPPPRVEVFDESIPLARTEALQALAPPWTSLEQGLLTNQLLVQWFVEEHTPAVHIRVFLPIHQVAEPARGTAVAIVAQALRDELQNRLQKSATSVTWNYRFDHIEIALYGQSPYIHDMLLAVGQVFAGDNARRTLKSVQKQWSQRLGSLDASELAIAELTARSLGRKASVEQLEADLIRELSIDRLLKTWQQLVQPQTTVLLVHANVPASSPQIQSSLLALANAWGAPGEFSRESSSIEGEGRTRPSVMQRLRAQEAKQQPHRFLLTGEPKAPLLYLDALQQDSKRPTLWLARTIPLANFEDRSMARLAQRILQEKYDVRLSISGSLGIWLMQIPLGREKSPAKNLNPAEANDDLQKTLERIRKASLDRYSNQRLLQAVELWLGARMVQASLQDEDWTALWSDSFDLSLRDQEIPTALARDAQVMMNISPEQLQQWSVKWLDFAAGNPGWMWLATGSKAHVRELARQLGVEVKPVDQEHSK